MLTFVNIVITEHINNYPIFLFMSTVLHQQNKRVESSETAKIEQENRPRKNSVNDTLSRYFIWFVNNNIEEFQIFTKFCNQRFSEQTSLFLDQRK